MKFELICTSGDDLKMTDYIYKIRMLDIKVQSETTTDPYNNESRLRYTIYLNSLEDLLKLRKAMDKELVLGPSYKDIDCIEITDYWRE